MIVQSILPPRPGDKFGVAFIEPKGFSPDAAATHELRDAVGYMFPFDEDMPPGLTFATTKLRDGRVVVWHLVPLTDAKDRRLN